MSLYPMYARPRTLEEASGLLAGLSSGVVIIAGGQEILPAVNYGVMMPEVYVDIGGLDALRGISVQGNELVIGALTVHRDIVASAEVRSHAPLLAASAAQIGGGWQVQNRGTIGGNIVAMHPLYDIAPALLALEAEVEICAEQGVRRVSFADVLADTSLGLGSDAILTRVFIAAGTATRRWGYYKLKNTSGAYGSANAAVVVNVAEGALHTIRVVIGAAADRLTLVDDALSTIMGGAYNAAAAEEIERVCAAAIIEPLSDQQGGGDWRRAMAGVVARRAIEEALARGADVSA